MILDRLPGPAREEFGWIKFGPQRVLPAGREGHEQCLAHPAWAWTSYPEPKQTNGLNGSARAALASASAGLAPDRSAWW